MEYRTLIALIFVFGLLIAVCLFHIARLSDEICMNREPKPHVRFPAELADSLKQLQARQAEEAPSYPTLWQVMADLQVGNLTLRDAYRIARAHLRAAKRDHRNV
ncbi:hypothetical protein [Burkholderia multivorans]|uniref:hypothetical protein n=1 Tax=Burkholderia multivorans TaxID=87883 RepID=UPI000D46BF08|nr:hypothetical protein [Burkholderia multivorans]MCO8643192.1 hypothetical protein [Burkholderia multivorans]PRE60568.1 hypothetical protein C6P95_25185 [Burkholderia multivorans]